MDGITKKVNVRVRTKQIELIVDTMLENPQLNGTKFTSTFTAAKRLQAWEELAHKLNSIGGANKSVKTWQKCWSDKKGDVKKKYNLFKAALRQTGGGPNNEKPLSTLEEKILSLIGLDAAEGVNVMESEELPEGYVIPGAGNGPSSSSSYMMFASSEPLTQEFNVVEAMSDSTSVMDIADPSTPQATMSSPQVTGSRCQPFKKRVRTKPLLIKNENAKKLIEGQAEQSSALMRCAAALEEHNEIDRAAWKEKNDIERRKAIAFEGILEVLQNKFG